MGFETVEEQDNIYIYVYIYKILIKNNNIRTSSLIDEIRIAAEGKGANQFEVLEITEKL